MAFSVMYDTVKSGVVNIIYYGVTAQGGGGGGGGCFDIFIHP